jgi:endonuclease/exonuclease/phosphatase family metal-dependent hydrolase
MESIFYLRDRFAPLDKSTFWLSETPEVVGSKGWNAVLPRIVSWVKFWDLENEREFYFFNTHFSHVGDEARINSAKLLVEQVVNIAGNKPVIISGDFNCTKDSDPYFIITDTGNGLPSLFDTHYISESQHFGGMNSINAFGKSKREAIIDYIFCSDDFKVSTHGILVIQKDSVYVSDHYPVISELSFKPKD